MTKENHTGIKHDQGKPRFSLMPPLAELEVAKVLTFGAEKYAPDNWRGIDPIRYVDAAGRHINATRRGEAADDESGLHHLAHAICCLMFQLEKELESEKKPAAQEPQQAPVGTFSTNDLPMIGQDYYYRLASGVVYARRWQSSPQEWKRLAAGQVFKTFAACKNTEHTGTYIFHEDDSLCCLKARELFWYVGVNRASSKWVAMNFFPDDEKKGMEIANDIRSRGDAATSKEHAEAKAYWRNVSMKRHGTPYGPLHPDAKQSDEPFLGNDKGEAHG